MSALLLSCVLLRSARKMMVHLWEKLAGTIAMTIAIVGSATLLQVASQRTPALATAMEATMPSGALLLQLRRLRQKTKLVRRRMGVSLVRLVATPVMEIATAVVATQPQVA